MFRAEDGATGLCAPGAQSGVRCHASFHPPGSIDYDGTRRLFRLRSKDSVYAFRIDDQRNLEHLYWGPVLPGDDDITYLTRAHVPAPFDPRGFLFEATLPPEFSEITLGGASLTESWRVYTKASRAGDLMSASTKINNRRLENASWRLWQMARKQGGDLNQDLSETVLESSLQGKPNGYSTAPTSTPSEKPTANGSPAIGAKPPAPLHHAASAPGLHTRGEPQSPLPASRTVPGTQVVSHLDIEDINLELDIAPSPESDQGEDGERPVEPETPRIGPARYGLLDALDLHKFSRSDVVREQVSKLVEREHAPSGASDHGSTGIGSGIPYVSSEHSLADTGTSLATNHAPTHGGRSPGPSPSPSPRYPGLPSPGRSLAGGMGSRKPSFADLASAPAPPTIPEMSLPSPQAATSSTVGASSLSVSASATNWESLDPEMVGKSSKLLEFSDSGTGDFREPSFKVRYERDGSTVSPTVYSGHRISRGKPAMPENMPSLRVEAEDEAATLEVDMVDAVMQLKVTIVFTVYRDYDVITRRTVVQNLGSSPVVLSHLASTTVDFDTESQFYMTQLSGGWARERQIVTRKLDDGLTVVKSSRGASSHQFNPFMVVSPDREPDEKHGECFSFCLVYSGNFLGTAEVSEYGRLRVNLGLNPDGFTWHLDAADSTSTNESFHSPEVVMSYSNGGLGGMSRQLHRLFRERLLPRRWRYSIPPVLLNTWEATYFDVSHEVVVEIAGRAALAGIELLVLDDGWFGKRSDTYSGLGDWTPNYEKLPHGLDGLARDVNKVGLKFGIWIEPEMVSQDSELYRKHKDWCLHVPSRSRTTGRNQLVLDFSRQCVRDNIFDQLKAMLSSANIEYVKWDMNRHLTEVFSQDMSASRQGEVAHRYMLGVYEVFSRITAEFPDVLFESCSGGGGRFDAGMLYFSPQVWTSDNTDALSRVSIQYGTSLAYPASAMGSHVSTVPNHQTLRSTTVKTRSLIAMSGTYGYELDPREMTDADIDEVRSYIGVQKLVAPLVYKGDMYRLWSPFSSDSCAWMFVAVDKREAVVIATNVRRLVGRLEPRLRLDGLDLGAVYSVEELCPGTKGRNLDTGAIDEFPRGVYQYGRGGALQLSGMTLCRAGLPIKFLFDADSVVFMLKASS